MNARPNCLIAFALMVVSIHAVRLAPCVDALGGDRIQPYKKNPFYWQYKGKPVLLLGGSDDDNLFQWTRSKLTDQLDLLKSVGGNYVRNTMSDRDPGNVYAFNKLSHGKYDLNRWNDAYWDRLNNFLQQTWQRGIIVQIEIWDAFDWMDRYGYSDHPWNPKNNINYTAQESGLPTSWPHSPHRRDHPFVLTVPGLANAGRGKVVLPFQRKFVAKVLKVCLRYDHVLFTIMNETSAPHQWSDYWAAFLHSETEARGRTVYVSDMREEDIAGRNPHQYVIARPKLYTFLEVSKTSRSHREAHWDRILLVRSRVSQSDQIRPMNNTKIMYGPPFRPRTDAEKMELGDKFWRDIFGGTASARFHRVYNGLGLTELAQTHIKSARLFTDAMRIFSVAPHNDLLSKRSDNEAYTIALPGKQYAVFFPGLSTADGVVGTDLSAASGTLRARWLDIANSRWAKEETLQAGDVATLERPGSGPWAVLITVPSSDQ